MNFLPRVSVRALLLALPFTTVISAQTTVVSPAGWANVESPSGNAFPLGVTGTPYRYLSVHDDMAGNPGLIQGFAMRRSATTSDSVVAAFSVTVDGFMSTAVTTGSTLSATFDNNHGADKVQVLTARTVNFPQAPTGLLPYPFLYAFPLDVPFGYLGAGPLCWDLQITARMNQPSLILDQVTNGSTNPSMPASWYGTGCMATGRTVAFRTTGGSSNHWTTGTIRLSATAQNGPADAPAILLQGFDPTNWNGIPLPIPIPLTNVGGPSGTCYLQAPGLVQIAATLSSSGSNTFYVDAPASPLYHGLRLYSQAVALDLPANSLGIVSASAVNHQIVAPYSAPAGGRVYDSGSLGPTGSVNSGYVLVVQFQY